MKYYIFETLFLSLADELSAYLKSQKIEYERSATCPGYHFNILLDPMSLALIRRWLDCHTICEEVEE